MKSQCENMKENLKEEKKVSIKKLKDEEQEIRKLNEESTNLKKALNDIQLQIRSCQVKINDNKRFIKHR